MSDKHAHGHGQVRRPIPTINVTPLIDVLLVLLIIFMVIQPYNERKLPVRAPQPAAAETEPSPETLMLTVSSDLHLELNSHKVEMDRLMPVLSNVFGDRPPGLRTLFIKAPAGLRYEAALVFVDLARGAGAETIGLIAE
jgi:biopolymer transport protein ExbD